MNVFTRIALLGVSSAFSCSLLCAAHADSTYLSKTAFMNRVGAGYYLETFDSFGSFVGVPTPYTFSSNGFTYDASTPSTDTLFTVSPDSSNFSDIALSTASSATPITLTFTSGNVTAVGGSFFLTDFPGNAAAGTVVVTLDDGTTQTLTGTSKDPEPFVGFTSNVPIASLTMTTGVNFYFNTINNLVVGTAVPEPGMVALLLGAGLSSVALIKRRRK